MSAWDDIYAEAMKMPYPVSDAVKMSTWDLYAEAMKEPYTVSDAAKIYGLELKVQTANAEIERLEKENLELRRQLQDATANYAATSKLLKTAYSQLDFADVRIKQLNQ